MPIQQKPLYILLSVCLLGTGVSAQAALANNTASDVAVTHRQANLSVTKSDGVNAVRPGATTAYGIVASHGGPSTADGRLLRDPAVTGLGCTSVTCTGTTGSAVCPASPTVPDFQGAGLLLSPFPVNSSVTLAVHAWSRQAGSDRPAVDETPFEKCAKGCISNHHRIQHAKYPP